MTGTVIDSGDGITHVFPICDGAVIPSAVQDIPLAGSDITEYIKNELKKLGRTYLLETLMKLLRKLKRDMGMSALT